MCYLKIANEVILTDNTEEINNKNIYDFDPSESTAGYIEKDDLFVWYKKKNKTMNIHTGGSSEEKAMREKAVLERR